MTTSFKCASDSFRVCVLFVSLRKTLKLRKNLSFFMHSNNLLGKIQKCQKLTGVILHHPLNNGRLFYAGH